MNNLFNFLIMINSKNNEKDLYTTNLNGNITIIRDDLYPFGTKNRLLKARLIRDIREDKFAPEGSKLCYKARWFDSTQVALADYCSKINIKLKIFTLLTNRDNNAFSELAKTFDNVQYIYFDSEEEMDIDYQIFIKKKEYTPIPPELDTPKSEKILNNLIDNFNFEYDDVWVTIVDSDLLARIFHERGKKVHILKLTNFQLTFTPEETFQEEYGKYDEKYSSYPSNSYVDGRLYKYFKDIKNKKILVWNSI